MAPFCVFWWHFLAHFGTYVTFWHLFYIIWGLLGLLRCFVANYIFCNLPPFWVKYFLLKPCLCKKVVFLHVWVLVAFFVCYCNTSSGSIWPCFQPFLPVAVSGCQLAYLGHSTTDDSLHTVYITDLITYVFSLLIICLFGLFFGRRLSACHPSVLQDT